MATAKDLRDQIATLKKQYDILNGASIDQKTGKYVAGGKSYSEAELKKRASDVQADINALKNVLKPVTDAESKVKSAAATGPGQELDAAGKKILAAAKAKLKEVEASDFTVPALKTVETPAPAPTPAPTTEKPAMATGVQGGRGVSPGATAKEIKAAQKKGKKPKTPKAPGTTTTTTPADTTETTTTPAAAPTVDWQTTFRSMFPSQAWLLDLDAAKYPKLRSLLEQAAKNRMWETTDGQQRFATQLDGTDFYQELKTNNIVRDIKSTVGDLGFDSTSFNAFITKAMNMGWKGDNLRFETYREAFRTDETTGQYVNPVTVDRVKKSTPWLAVAKIGTDFFSQVSDQDIQKTLTGEMSNDDVLRKQRELAKTKYAHLGSLIDQGFTLDELSTSFKTKAAQMLEVDPTTINMADTKWESAINYGEEGKKRMMTTGEWELLLRTDKQYNWDKTENAKQEARRLADTISQAFGRVL